MSLPHALALLLVAVLTGGCATGPYTEAPDWLAERKRAEFLETQRSLARSREDAGDLPGALHAWRNVAAADRQDSSAATEAQVARLQERVDARFEEHVAAAQRAETAGRADAAQRHWLAALAYRPDRTELMERLRRSHGERVLAALATSPLPPRQPEGPEHAEELEYPEAEAPAVAAGAARPAQAGMPDAAAPEVLEQTLARLTRAAAGEAVSPALEQRIDELRAQVAEGYYRRGRALFRSDLQAAIEAFRLALRHAPEHARARQYLLTAIRLRERAQQRP